MNPKIELVEIPTSDEISDIFFRKCSFCTKLYQINPINFKILERVAGNRPRCPFCLRHNFKLKKKHILVFSLRPIIAHIYYNHYWLSEKPVEFSKIRRIISEHEAEGLKNPLLSYDPESYLWFADFSKIGDKRVSVSEICFSIKSMVDVLKVETFEPDFNSLEFLSKFDQAILKFQKNRFRPKNSRILSPTLGLKSKVGLATLKNFTEKEILVKTT